MAPTDPKGPQRQHFFHFSISLPKNELYSEYFLPYMKFYYKIILQKNSTSLLPILYDNLKL